MSTQESSKVRVITHTALIYETTDGREFEDKDEAFEWQKSLDILEDIVMLNCKHERTRNIDEAYYVYASTDEQVEAFNLIQDYDALIARVGKPGFYAYDENCDEYLNLESEIRKLQEHIDLLKEEDKK